jgi:L-asparagine transporter-like permease
MEHVIGDQWPIGLGFWHPQYRYVADLPDGSIRNADLGISNILMTMGVVGALLLYAPLLFAFVALQRARTQHRSHPRDEWMVYGLATWLLIAILASATMSTLFTVNGLVLAAVVVAIGLRLISAEASASSSAR